MAGMAGFEPANEGVKVPCLTAWLHPYMPLSAAWTGFEGLFLSVPKPFIGNAHTHSARVRGTRYNTLYGWWERWESNPQIAAFEAVAYSCSATIP